MIKKKDIGLDFTLSPGNGQIPKTYFFRCLLFYLNKNNTMKNN